MDDIRKLLGREADELAVWNWGVRLGVGWVELLSWRLSDLGGLPNQVLPRHRFSGNYGFLLT